MNEISIKDLKKLPDDIVKMIYFDYLETNLLYEEIIKIINSQTCKKLEYKFLSKIIEKHKDNYKLIKILRNKAPCFNLVYEHHIIKNNKYFVLLSNIYDSLALSWLMYLYH